MDRIKKAVVFVLLWGATGVAGDIGEYGRTLELRNWLTANNVEITEMVNLFLSLPDAVPISDTSGLIKPDAVYRTTNTNRTKGWVNKVIKRLHVQQNGHPAYWVYHIETTLAFDLTPKK